MSHMDPRGVFSTVVADGYWLYLKGEYTKAVDSFTTALDLQPGDKSCFVGRSKCYLKMGEPENALKDAEASLKEDKSFFKGLYQKAEALYYMGEFEYALVFYHRGQKLRPQMEEFRLGIQKAQESIENSVGSPTSTKLEIKGDLSFLQKDEEPITAIKKLTKEKKQHIPTTAKSKKTTKHLLGEFYNDKKYLENLLKDEEFVKGKRKSGEKLKNVIQNSLAYLDNCTEFWTKEKPICAQDKGRKLPQKGGKPDRGLASEPAQFLLKSLQDIDAELASGNAKGSLRRAEKVLKRVQEWSDKEIPNKMAVMGSLHSCIGNALIKLGNMDRALEHHKNNLELAEQCKLPESMSRALDNIGGVYVQMRQFAQAIEFLEKKIPLLRVDLEKAWLFHKLGWCYMELNRHEESRVKLGNVESCVTYFERALTIAKQLEDHSAIKAIQKSLDAAKQLHSDTGSSPDGMQLEKESENVQ